jgi:hypothetical protein
MNSFIKRHRTASLTGAVLVVAIITAVAMPAQAVSLGEKAASTIMHLHERFCGHHHHHHGHQWCDGYRPIGALDIEQPQKYSAFMAMKNECTLNFFTKISPQFHAALLRQPIKLKPNSL